MGTYAATFSLVYGNWLNMPLFNYEWNDDNLNSRVDEVRNSKDFQKSSRMGRLGEPIEMAKIMAFMVSDDNSYMSGSEIISDGGIGAMPWKMEEMPTLVKME